MFHIGARRFTGTDQAEENADVVGATLAEALHYAAGRTGHGRGRRRDADMISTLPGSSETALIDAALEYTAREDRNGKGCLNLLCRRRQRVRMTGVSNLRIRGQDVQLPPGAGP